MAYSKREDYKVQKFYKVQPNTIQNEVKRKTEMKEYKLDTTTLMGAWYISKKLCDKIIKVMNNNNLTPGIMYRQGQQTVVKEAKESFELSVGVDNDSEPFNEYRQTIQVWHCENDFKSFNYDRCLVFMTYLNDVEDGGTSFKYQNINMPAKKGLTVLWPAYWTHTHKGVISFTKEKYIATGWLNYIEHRQMQIEQGKIQ